MLLSGDWVGIGFSLGRLGFVPGGKPAFVVPRMATRPSRLSSRSKIAGTRPFPVMAIRLERAFGSTARRWLAMQMFYDLWHAQQQAARERARGRRRGSAPRRPDGIRVRRVVRPVSPGAECSLPIRRRSWNLNICSSTGNCRSMADLN
jgi:hypothetical protein